MGLDFGGRQGAVVERDFIDAADRIGRVHLSEGLAAAADALNVAVMGMALLTLSHRQREVFQQNLMSKSPITAAAKRKPVESSPSRCTPGLP